LRSCGFLSATFEAALASEFNSQLLPLVIAWASAGDRSLDLSLVETGRARRTRSYLRITGSCGNNGFGSFWLFVVRAFLLPTSNFGLSLKIQTKSPGTKPGVLQKIVNSTRRRGPLARGSLRPFSDVRLTAITAPRMRFDRKRRREKMAPPLLPVYARVGKFTPARSIVSPVIKCAFFRPPGGILAQKPLKTLLDIFSVPPDSP
jgi:hypothetical protein